MSITIIGSLNYDLVTYTDKVPQAGETFQANSFENHLGGKGLNEAIAAARLLPKDSPIKVRMVGNIGDDTFGTELKQALVDSNVDTQFITTIPNTSSGVAVILVEESGENRILITAGANSHLRPTPKDYQKYFASDPTPNSFVLLQNEYPDTIKSIEWLKENRPSINVAYNPSPFKNEGLDVWSKIDLLIVNEGEAIAVASSLLSAHEVQHLEAAQGNERVAGFSSLAAKIHSLINSSNVHTVVITMGSVGSVYVGQDCKVHFEPSRNVPSVVDTTGAGDTFFGGVVSKLAARASLEDAIKFATVASSLVIQKKGAVESIPEYEHVQ